MYTRREARSAQDASGARVRGFHPLSSEITGGVVFEFEWRPRNFQRGILSDLSPEVLAERDSSEIQRVLNSADGDFRGIELAHGGHQKIQAFAVGREMERCSDCGEGTGSSRVNPARIDIDSVEHAVVNHVGESDAHSIAVTELRKA